MSAGPADIAVCPGCGSRLLAVDGPTHAYMTSSPACWAAFGQVMADEYADPERQAHYRLAVDAWAVQHPGDGSRRAIQSVGLHLARLMAQLECGRQGPAANDAMLGFAARKAELPEMTPVPPFSMTVADVVAAPDRPAAIRAWAESAWADWSHHHEFISRWAASG